MTPEFDEVLLTAYLDDEVSDAERAAVEEQLKTSESARKLLTELQSVRDRIRHLHLATPIRSFQKGPWSDNDQNEQAIDSSEISTGHLPQVTLRNQQANWSLPLSRLISIAAMIAIAVCGSVLFFGPKILKDNSKPGSIAFSAGTSGAIQDEAADAVMYDAKEQSPRLDSEMPATAMASSAMTDPTSAMAPTDSKQIAQAGLADKPSPAFGRSNAPTDGIPKLEKKAGNNRGATSAAPPSKSIEPSGGMGSRIPSPKSESFPPAPAVALSLERNESSSKEKIVPESQDIDVSLGTLVEKFFTVHGFEKGTLALQNEVDALATLRLSEASESRLRSESQKEDESNARYYFKYPANGQADAFDRSSGLTSIENSALNEGLMRVNSGLELGMGAAKDSMDVKSLPLLIEIQIQSNQWATAAERLRQLGLQVPAQVPTEKFIDFKIVPLEKDPLWTFQIDDSGDAKRVENQPASDRSLATENRAETKVTPLVHRIRIRAVK